MSSRQHILQAIASNKPSAIELPVIDTNSVIQYSDLVEQFKSVLSSIGGTSVQLQGLDELKAEVAANSTAGAEVVNRVAALGDISEDISALSATELAFVDIAYISAEIGVAENGCVWLYESQMGNRLLPFICQHLVVLIKKQNILATMHDAYEIVDTAREGFGVFIAGPSKTADIEQSLVIGAHGARSLVVYILES